MGVWKLIFRFVVVGIAIVRIFAKTPRESCYSSSTELAFSFSKHVGSASNSSWARRYRLPKSGEFGKIREIRRPVNRYSPKITKKVSQKSWPEAVKDVCTCFLIVRDYFWANQAISRSIYTNSIAQNWQKIKIFFELGYLDAFWGYGEVEILDFEWILIPGQKLLKDVCTCFLIVRNVFRANRAISESIYTNSIAQNWQKIKIFFQLGDLDGFGGYGEVEILDFEWILIPGQKLLKDVCTCFLIVRNVFRANRAISESIYTNSIAQNWQKIKIFFQLGDLDGFGGHAMTKKARYPIQIDVARKPDPDIRAEKIFLCSVNFVQ